VRVARLGVASRASHIAHRVSRVAMSRSAHDEALGAKDGYDWARDSVSSAFDSLSTFATTSTSTLTRSAQTAMNSTSTMMAHMSRERVAWFVALMGTSVVMYALALFVGAPTMALAPAKFGLCLSAGGACSIGATGALRGAQAQLAHMTSEGRLGASVAMGLAMMMTLRAALVTHSYVGTLFWSIVQTVAVAYYQVTYFPYGAQGARAVMNVAMSLGGPALAACARGVGAAWSAMYGGSSGSSNGVATAV
jgi:hypothetical protein